MKYYSQSRRRYRTSHTNSNYAARQNLQRVARGFIARRRTRHIRNKNLRIKPFSRVNFKPELKYSKYVYPLSASYAIPLSFAVNYPSTNWSSVDLFPGQGSTDTTRIGNAITINDIELDLYMRVNDLQVDMRVVVFQWLSPQSPDSVTWLNPVTTTGGRFNPVFPAKSDSTIKILYQKWINTNKYMKTMETSGSSTAYFTPFRVHYKETLNQTISCYDENLATSMTGSSTSDVLSYKGRVYFCIVTNNFAGSDIGFAGSWGMTFSDT